MCYPRERPGHQPDTPQSSIRFVEFDICPFSLHSTGCPPPSLTGFVPLSSCFLIPPFWIPPHSFPSS